LVKITITNEYYGPKYKCDKKFAYKFFQNLLSLMLSVLTEIWRMQMSFWREILYPY